MDSTSAGTARPAAGGAPLLRFRITSSRPDGAADAAAGGVRYALSLESLSSAAREIEKKKHIHNPFQSHFMALALSSFDEVRVTVEACISFSAGARIEKLYASLGPTRASMRTPRPRSLNSHYAACDSLQVTPAASDLRSQVEAAATQVHVRTEASSQQCPSLPSALRALDHAGAAV